MPARPVPAKRKSVPLLRRLARPVLPTEVLEFWGAKLRPAWSVDRPLARVVSRHVEASDAVTLVLQPNRHWRGFLPGQHVNLGIEVNGVRLSRSYSLVDVPRADGRVSITVRAIGGGRVSRHLLDSAKAGDVFEISPAFGEMVLPDTHDAPLLFLAAGSGITPLMSMTRALAEAGMPTSLTLIYSARRRGEFCFADELRALAKQHAQLDVRFLLTGDTASTADESEGRLDAAHLDAFVSDLSGHRVFACGPSGFVEHARALVSARILSFEAEAFSPPPRVETADDAGTVQVVLARSERTLTVPRGQSLLVALEAAGLTPASGCRMGICNTCACAKRAGSTRQVHTGDMEHEPAILKLCVNAAASDLVLDL